MKECDKRKSHISNKLHMIYASSDNVRHTVNKAFTTLRPTTLNPTSLHFTRYSTASSIIFGHNYLLTRCSKAIQLYFIHNRMVLLVNLTFCILATGSACLLPL